MNLFTGWIDWARPTSADPCVVWDARISVDFTSSRNDSLRIWADFHFFTINLGCL